MLTDQQKKEWWFMFATGLIIGAFVGWQVWLSINLWQWVNRKGMVYQNYLYQATPSAEASVSGKL